MNAPHLSPRLPALSALSALSALELPLSVIELGGMGRGEDRSDDARAVLVLNCDGVPWTPQPNGPGRR